MRDILREQPLILVVDQDQTVLDEMVAVLASGGFTCHCCLTAEAALAAGPLLLPDLIVADIHLDGTSGVEVCERLTQHESLADVPVMYLSAGQIPDIIRRRDGGHGTYYLRKPFDPTVLAELIEHALGMQRELAVPAE